MCYLVDCRIEEFRSGYGLADTDNAPAQFWIAKTESLIKVSGTDSFCRLSNYRSGSVRPDKGVLDNPFIIGVKGKVESNLPVPDMCLANGQFFLYLCRADRTGVATLRKAKQRRLPLFIFPLFNYKPLFYVTVSKSIS